MAQALNYLIDEHLTPEIAVQLTAKGIDAVHCTQVRLGGATDDDLITYAIQENRAIVTVDADFLRENAIGTAHSGIFRVHAWDKDNIGKIIDWLVSFAELIEGGAGTLEEDIHNQVQWLR